MPLEQMFGLGGRIGETVASFEAKLERVRVAIEEQVNVLSRDLS